MKTLLILFSLNNPTGDEPAVINYCKSFSKWATPLKNVWFVKSDTKKSSQIRDEINTAIGGRGKVVVMDVTGANWGTLAIAKEVTTWMKDNL